jgi:hypothetical protein
MRTARFRPGMLDLAKWRVAIIGAAKWVVLVVLDGAIGATVRLFTVGRILPMVRARSSGPPKCPRGRDPWTRSHRPGDSRFDLAAKAMGSHSQPDRRGR